MDQQPDKLFRDKLKDYKKPAPAGSWNRIAGNLHKENNRGIWLKAAAAILILAVAGVFLLSTRDKSPEKIIAGNVTLPEIEKSSPVTEPAPSENSTRPSPDQKTSPVAGNKKPEGKTKSAQRKNTIAPAVAQPVNEHKPPVAYAEVVPEESPEENIAVINEPVMVPAPENDRGVTLIYSADEVNEKYLSKSALAEATPDEKRSSTLRKLLDKAYDLKHNQDPLGELRQKKNEILALNFRNDKQRSQNR